MYVEVDKTSAEEKISKRPDQYLRNIVCFADLPGFFHKFSSDSALYLRLTRVTDLPGLEDAIKIINSSTGIAEVKILKKERSFERDFYSDMVFDDVLVKITTTKLIPSAKIITERVIGMILRLFDRDVGKSTLGRVNSFQEIIDLSKLLGGNHNLGQEISDLSEEDLLNIFNPFVMNRVFREGNIFAPSVYSKPTGFNPRRHIQSSCIYKAIRKYLEEENKKEIDMLFLSYLDF